VTGGLTSSTARAARVADAQLARRGQWLLRQLAAVAENGVVAPWAESVGSALTVLRRAAVFFDVSTFGAARRPSRPILAAESDVRVNDVIGYGSRAG
jgi:hypothetical protein